MWFAVSWFGVALLLAVWSVACWAFHAVAWWTLTGASALVARGGAQAAGGDPGGRMPPAWADAWGDAMAAAVPALQSVLGWAPSVMDGLTVLIWGVWAVGALVLLAAGWALHLAVRRMQHDRAPAPVI